MKRILLLFFIFFLTFNVKSEGMSDRELSTVITVAPFYVTTEAVSDFFTTNIYEEARRIASDGVITEEEYTEMSIDLQVELDACMNDYGEFDSEISCLRWISQFDD